MSSITIVTAFFTMPSKFSTDTYREWMGNFLSLDENMIIFTDKENFSYIEKIRKSKKDKTSIIQSSIKDFDVYKHIDYWEYCKRIDREHHIHSKELYMIWNEKPFFMEKALKMNKFNSEYFFWMDIGCVRDPIMLTRIGKFSCDGIPSDKIILSKVTDSQINTNLNNHGISVSFENRGNICCPILNCIQGGFFGGHKNAVKNWVKMYKNELNLFMVTGTFGGKDQYIMGNLTIKFPEYITVLKPEEFPKFNSWWSFLVRMTDLQKYI